MFLFRDLSDVDKDGRLSSDEFAIAMFLVEKARKGIPPPTTLPLELQPKKGSLESHSPSLASNFEDRRRENFEKGRAELERRRRAIEEKEQKEKVCVIDSVELSTAVSFCPAAHRTNERGNVERKKRGRDRRR